MNMKKVIIISLLLMILLVPVSFAEDGDYTIPWANKDITVNDDGSTLISETIYYEIEGSVNGVYRDIPLNNNQTITNISVETPGYYNTAEVIRENGKTRIKVWLYVDANKRLRTSDASVKVIYKYTFNKGVKIYNDIAELQYMSWGNEWKSGVDSLVTNIHIPGSNRDTEYWNNPDDYVVTSGWSNDNTLTTEAEGIGSYTSFEQRILMPKSYFKSSENAQVINMDAKAQIEADQQKYKEDRDFKNTVTSILSGLFGLLMVVPVAIYALFGREPKIPYKADYEYDLPTDSSPVEVNSLVNGDAGSIDDNAMYATLLDLINRKVFKVFASNEDDTILTLVNNDTTGLKTFEKSLIQFLSQFESNGNISLKSIADTCDPEVFKNFRETWKDQTSQEVPDLLIKKYFIDKGYVIFNFLSFGLMALSIIIFIALMFIEVAPQYYWILFAITVLMFCESIIMLFIPNTVPGRWTPEGKEYHDKWKNFENYITDFSLIKERPPASIQVWGKYLVYAAALGCADEVSKNMKEYFNVAGVPEEYFNSSDAVMFAYYGGFNHLDTTFNALTPSETSSGGIGSVGGGGFGGGGGGTF